MTHQGACALHGSSAGPAFAPGHLPATEIGDLLTGSGSAFTPAPALEDCWRTEDGFPPGRGLAFFTSVSGGPLFWVHAVLPAQFPGLSSVCYRAGILGPEGLLGMAPPPGGQGHGRDQGRQEGTGVCEAVLLAPCTPR